MKRHISVDILGLPHAIHVITANVTDRKGALEMYEHYPELKETLKAILTDGGDTGETFQKKFKSYRMLKYRLPSGQNCIHFK